MPQPSRANRELISMDKFDGTPSEHIKPNFGFAPTAWLLQFINRGGALLRTRFFHLASLEMRVFATMSNDNHSFSQSDRHDGLLYLLSEILKSPAAATETVVKKRDWDHIRV